MDLIKASLSDCYCYNQNSQVKWKYIWSTVQVQITSPGPFSVVYITERYNCQYPETILSIIRCMFHNFWTPEESNDRTIIIHPYGQTVCFSVKPARKIFMYTISVKQNSKSVFIIRDFLAQLFWSDISVSCLSFTDCTDAESVFVVCLCFFFFLLQLWISSSSLCLWWASSSSFTQRP